MIADLKPYPTYKDSGVPWLGEVPKHWKILPGLACYQQKKEPNPDLRETTVLSLSYGRIVVKPEDKLHGLVPASFETYQIVQPGEIVIRPTDLQNDQNSLRFGISHNRGIITSAYMCFQTQETLTPEYGHLLLHTLDLKKIFYGLGSGLRQNLDWKDFKYLPCLAPPRPEQDCIVRFLDLMDRRIRRYIRAKQKLIKVLEEQKQAVIHRAVTRGLDPNAPLKPSGVPWLGDVPEHWKVLPLKRLGWFKSGAGFPVQEQGGQNCEVPFLKVSDMNRPGNELWIATSDSTVSRKTAERLGAFVFPENTIIFPKVGGALLTNKRRLLHKPSCIDNNVMGCVVAGADFRYAFILLQQLDLGRLAKPGPVPAISESDVREIKVVLPPLDEQMAVVREVHHSTANLDSTVFALGREISFLREYRTRLITDVVTGKLDVREAAARLSAEAEEPEQLDEVEALADGEEDGEGADLDHTPEEAAGE